MSDQIELFNFTMEPATPKPPVSTQPSYKCGKLYDVSPEIIKTNPLQPRKCFADDSLSALTESVKKQGILQPLVCILSTDGQLQLAAGERRLRSALQAGLTKVPVMVVSGDLAEISLIENMLREDLTAVEEAEAVQDLREKKGYSLENMAKMLGKAVSTVSEMLAVATLPQIIRDDCRSDRLMPRDILIVISRRENDDLKIAAYEDFKVGKLTRKELKPGRLTPLIKSRKPLQLVKSFHKQFSQIDTTSITLKESTSLRSELEKLQVIIAEKLSNLGD